MVMSSAAHASLDPTNLDNFKNPLHLPGDDGLMGVLDASNASVSFDAHKASVEILPGKRADLLTYHAERDGKSYVNPTIRVQKGKQLSAEFTNDLDEETTALVSRCPSPHQRPDGVPHIGPSDSGCRCSIYSGPTSGPWVLEGAEFVGVPGPYAQGLHMDVRLPRFHLPLTLVNKPQDDVTQAKSYPRFSRCSRWVNRVRPTMENSANSARRLISATSLDFS